MYEETAELFGGFFAFIGYSEASETPVNLAPGVFVILSSIFAA